MSLGIHTQCFGGLADGMLIPDMGGNNRAKVRTVATEGVTSEIEDVGRKMRVIFDDLSWVY